MLPLAALLVGMRLAQGVDRWSDYSFRAFLVLSLASNWIFILVPGNGNDIRILAPLAELRTDVPRLKVWHQRLNEEAAQHPEMKLLCVGDAMVFDLEMPVVYATTFDRSPWLDFCFAGPDEPRDPRAVGAALEEAGVTHVYVDWGEIARYRSPGNYGFAEFVTPESFDRLVKAGALLTPLRDPRSLSEVFPVPKRSR